ncbi:hypothetical protein KIM372_04450 [Bombiscardovia nodaiensis]|uniref:Uncharacterized protein n=1 Tax=Bombiscardovia nodaiensis TaxID=2932181 RepID=A0ABN6SAT5_9BIFI|nr:hypothetical protein KIM372_04450 [Bombiscardovia nodaiensis]
MEEHSDTRKTRISRCTRGKPAIYQWIGQPIKSENEFPTPLEIGNHFANIIAKDKFISGALTYYSYEAFRIRIATAIAAKIKHASLGMLAAGSDVVPLASAGHRPLFEIRWEARYAYLRGGATVHIRQYVGEPSAEPNLILGLHAHEKAVSGSPAEIRILQNAQIFIAIQHFDQWQGAQTCEQ